MGYHRLELPWVGHRSPSSTVRAVVRTCFGATKATWKDIFQPSQRLGNNPDGVLRDRRAVGERKTSLHVAWVALYLE